MRFIRGHNNRGRAVKTDRYRVENRGYRTPCWTWTMKCGWNGYGYIRRNNKQLLAHRWMYEQRHGPLPDGLQLDHLCRNTDCVNPEHLDPVEGAENCYRSRARKLTPAQAREIIEAPGPARPLAEAFGLSLGYVYALRSGEERPRYLSRT